MRDFAKRVAAHIVTWFIVQPVYNRIIKAIRQRELANPSADTRTYWRYQAEAVADALESRSGDSPRYPFEDGGYTILGVDLFANTEHTVISWQGENFYLTADDALYVRAEESHDLADKIMAQLDTRHNPVELHAIRESVSAAIKELS